MKISLFKSLCDTLEIYLHQHKQNYFLLLSCYPVVILIFGGWAEKEEKKIGREVGRVLAKSSFLKVSRNPKYNGETDPEKSGLKIFWLWAPWKS